MTNAGDVFFDYPCDHCGQLFCGRVQVMNLALNYIEDQYCLDRLATTHTVSRMELATMARAYIASRECFKTAWDRLNVRACPLIATHQCLCQDTPQET